VLVSFDFSPRTIDVSSAAQVVTVTMQITDQTGVATPNITFNSRDTSQSSGFGTTTLISGTPTSGTWQSIITIDQSSAPGIWDATLFPLNDTLGNSNTTFGPPDGFPDELTVTS
jgi:serine protease